MGRARSRARLTRCTRLLGGVVALLLVCPLAGAPGPEAQTEIDHLLGFILDSSCRFVRNGRDYDADRAHRHVLRKFEYFEDEITTAEDFIEYSATRSTMSGRPYQFVCGDSVRESADVLREELARFREAGR
jgi:hypothetical protein